MGRRSTTHLGLLFADAYMRSLWEGHGRGVMLFGWKEDKREEEEKKKEDSRDEEQ